MLIRNRMFSWKLTNLSEKISRKLDGEKVYHLNYWVYVYTGFWKYTSGPKWKTYVYLLYKWLLILCYSLTIVCFIIDGYIVRNNIEKLSFNLTSSVLVVATLLRIVLLSKHKETLESIFDRLEKNLHLENVGNTEEDKEILYKNARRSLFMVKLFYSLLTAIFPLRVMAATALDKKSYIIPFPYQEKLTAYYEIIYSQQVILSAHFLITVIAHDMVIYGVIIRLIAHYEILQKNFLKIKKIHPRIDFGKYVQGYRDCDDETRVVEDVLINKTNYSERIQRNLNGSDQVQLVMTIHDKATRDEKTFEILTENIIHHQKIMSEIITFQQAYTQPFLVQMIGACSLIALVALQIILMSSKITLLLLQQVLYVVTTMLNILFMCSFASEITRNSEVAATALYDIPWYEMNVKNRKTILFILEKLLRAPKLRAGGMILISRETYLKMLQNAYSLVAFLRNI